MLKILVVDDEYMTRVGIKTVINRTGNDWQVVAEADNGKEALALAENLKVDLIITDIRMPDMNGIELMEQISQKELICEIIAVSAYQEFEYAKKAIQYGILDYVIKPVDPNNLVNIILKAEERIKAKASYDSIRSRISEDKKKLRDMIFTQLLFGYYKDEEKLILELDRVNCRVSEFIVLVAGRKPVIMPGVLADFIECLTDMFTGNGCLVQEVHSDDCMKVFLLWYETRQINMESVKMTIDKNMGAFGKRGICLGISNKYSSLTDMRLAFNQGLFSFNIAIETAGHYVLYSDICGIPNAVQYPYDVEYRLIHAVNSGNNDIVQKLIQELTNKIFEGNKSSNLYDIVMVSRRTIEAFKRLHAEAEEDAVRLEKGQVAEVSRLIGFLDVAEAKKWFVEEVTRISELIMKSKKVKTRKIIEQVKCIVHERFNTDITIKDISEEVYMNASYLSDLFKASTGMTFTEYLTDYRIEKAKEYLKHPKMKIYEVSEAVGYRNVRYFSQIFKKAVGMQPVEYKELLY